jgi:hypothetical protein
LQAIQLYIVYQTQVNFLYAKDSVATYNIRSGQG